jgi:hypothetical protein
MTKNISFLHIIAGNTSGQRRNLLDQFGDELLESRMFVRFDRAHFDTEFLSPRPANDGLIDKDSGMPSGQEDTESNHQSLLNRMGSIDTPPVERQIPGGTGSLELVTGIVHEALDGKSAE